MAEGTGMETIILIGIAVIILIGIAVIAFLLWQIKKAIDKLEANRRKLNLGPSLKLTAQGAGTLTSRPGPPDVQYRGVVVVVTITGITAGDALTVSIVGYDPATQSYFNTPFLTSAPLTEVGQTVLIVYPGIPAVANVAANSPVPNSNFWRLKATVTTGPVDAILDCLYAL